MDSSDSQSLREIVFDASDGVEFMDEVCKMVIDELDRLSVEQPRQ